MVLRCILIVLWLLASFDVVFISVDLLFFDLVCGYVAVYLLWTFVALFAWLLVGLVELIGFPLWI